MSAKVTWHYTMILIEYKRSKSSRQPLILSSNIQQPLSFQVSKSKSKTMTDCKMQVINDDLRSLISNESRSLLEAIDVVAGRKKFGWRIRFDSGFCFLDIYLYVCICVYFFMCIVAFLYFVSRMPASRGFGWRIVRLRRRFFFLLYICVVCIYMWF